MTEQQFWNTLKLQLDVLRMQVASLTICINCKDRSLALSFLRDLEKTISRMREVPRPIGDKKETTK